MTPLAHINDQITALRTRQRVLATITEVDLDLDDERLRGIVDRYQANHNTLNRLQRERVRLIAAGATWDSLRDPVFRWDLDDTADDIPVDFWEKSDAEYDRYRDLAVGL